MNSPIKSRILKKRKFGLTLSLLFVLLLAHARLALCFDIPEKPRDFVHDDASLLTSSQQTSLSEKLRDFDQKTTTQIVVAVFPTLGGDALEDVSIRLAEKWKVGQKGKDNGVILLIIPQDRVLRIEVGYGLEGAIPDIYASKIIDKVLKPQFREGHYYEGIDQATNLLMQAAQGEYSEAVEKGSNAGSEFLKFFAIAVIFLILTWFRQTRFPYWGGGTYSRGGWSSGSGGGFSGGGGGFGGGGSSGSW